MDKFIICARVLLIKFAEDLRILVGQEYKPWDLPLGMREISCKTLALVTCKTHYKIEMKDNQRKISPRLY